MYHYIISYQKHGEKEATPIGATTNENVAYCYAMSELRKIHASQESMLIFDYEFNLKKEIHDSHIWGGDENSDQICVSIIRDIEK